MTTKRTTHLTKLCNETLERLTEAMRLVKEVRDGDKGRRTDAARCLESMTRHIPYEGNVLTVGMDAILGEVGEMDADEAFGERAAG
jgi:hypothetical protein